MCKLIQHCWHSSIAPFFNWSLAAQCLSINWLPRLDRIVVRKHLNILSCLKFALTVIYIIGNENNQSEQFNGVLQTMFAFINGNKFRIDFTFNFKLTISANILEYDRKTNKKGIEWGCYWINTIEIDNQTDNRASLNGKR